MDKMNTPMFPLAEVAVAAGFKPTLPRQHIARGLFKLDAADAHAHTPGATTLLTGRTALKLGVALHLSGEVAVEDAVRAADIFAYSGSDEAQERAGVLRQPGGLFWGDDIVETAAVFSKGQGRTEWQISVIPLKKGMTVEECINSDSYGIHSLQRLLICPLDTVVDTLRRNLGLS